MTNTVKHALPKEGKGHIRASISVEDGPNTNGIVTKEGPFITFEFRDDGPGYPEAVLTQGESNIGLYLLKNIVTKDLHGELTMYNEQGAAALIRFKLVEGLLAQAESN